VHISDYAPQGQGRCHEFEGGGVNALEGGGRVNTVKTLTFEKGKKCMTPPLPPSSCGGAAPVQGVITDTKDNMRPCSIV